MLNLPAKKILIFFGLIILIFILLLLIPIEFPYTVTTPGKVLPAKSWVVVKGSGGQLITLVHNRKKGIIDSYSVKEFERGDNINLRLTDDFMIGKKVSERDTIGYLYSNEIERQIAELLGQVDVAKSTLEFSRTGEKEPIIKEAEANLRFQISTAEDQQRRFERQKALFEKNLISKEDFDSAANQAVLNEISIAIARARLESVSTGAKKEQLDLIENQIRSFQNQIEILKKKLSSYNLVSPINGVVSSLTSGDTLFTVSDDSDYILLIPVRHNDAQFIQSGADVEVHLKGFPEVVEARVDYVDHSAFDFGSGQAVVAVATIRSARPMTGGLLVECRLDGGTASFMDHLKRFLNKSIF